MTRLLWAVALFAVTTLVLWAGWRFHVSRQARSQEIELHRFEFRPNGEDPKK